MRRLALSFVIGALVTAPAPAMAFNPDSAAQVAVSPDSRFVYATVMDRTVTYGRDPATGGLSLLEDDEPGGGAIGISPDGRSAYVASHRTASAAEIHVLSRNGADGRLTHELSVEPGINWITSVVVSPDGRHVYVGSRTAGAIVVYERLGSTGLREVGRVFGGPAPGDIPDLHEIGELAISPDGAFLHVGSGAPIVLRRNPTSGLLTYAGRGSGFQASESVAVAPDGGRLYGGSDYVYARDPGSGTLTELSSAGPRGGFGRGSVSPDSALVLSTNPMEGSLSLNRAVPAGTERVAVWHPGFITPWYPAWSGDGRSVYVGGEAGRIGIWSRTGPASLAATGVVQIDGAVKAHRRPRDPSVTIDNGAEFTRSNAVSLTIGTPPGVSSLRISARPDFAGAPARRVTDDGVYPWRLRDLGLGRGVRRVYVRYVSRKLLSYEGSVGVHPPPDISDDIILDQRAPAVVAGRLKPVRVKKARRGPKAAASARKRRARRSTLRLRSRDNRSGVRRVQVTTRRSKPGRRRAYSRSITVKGTPRRVWVRVIDRAGNVSRWKSIRRR